MSKTLLTLAALGLLVAGLPSASAYYFAPPPVSLCEEGTDQYVTYCVVTHNEPQPLTNSPNPDSEPVSESCPVGQGICYPVYDTNDLLFGGEEVAVGIPVFDSVRAGANEDRAFGDVCIISGGRVCL